MPDVLGKLASYVRCLEKVGRNEWRPTLERALVYMERADEHGTMKIRARGRSNRSYA